MAAKPNSYTLDKEEPTPQVGKTPTTKAYGREIEMTDANGYKATSTADGNTVYQKVNRTGSNAKDIQLTNYYYDPKGNKITQAQHEAMIDGRLASAPSQIGKTPGKLTITNDVATKGIGRAHV